MFSQKRAKKKSGQRLPTTFYIFSNQILEICILTGKIQQIHLRLCFDVKNHLKLCFDVKIHLKLRFDSTLNEAISFLTILLADFYQLASVGDQYHHFFLHDQLTLNE